MDHTEKALDNEQVFFAVCSQFCHDTATDKQREIAEAEETIKELSASIDKATTAKAPAHGKQLQHGGGDVH